MATQATSGGSLRIIREHADQCIEGAADVGEAVMLRIKYLALQQMFSTSLYIPPF